MIITNSEILFPGFSQELPENLMSLAGKITLKCAWGSSDTPASVEWKIGKIIFTF